MPNTNKFIPIFILQHPRFSLADRVLFAYMFYANAEGICTLSTRSVAILVGLVDDEGEPTKKDYDAIRRCRWILTNPKSTKKGSVKQPVLTHVVRTTKRGGKQNCYFVDPVQVTQSALDLMSLFGSRQKNNPTEYCNVDWKRPDGSINKDIYDDSDLDAFCSEDSDSEVVEDGFDLDDLDDFMSED